MLFRRIATIELDAPVGESIDELEWTGPEPGFTELAESLDATSALRRLTALAESR